MSDKPNFITNVFVLVIIFTASILLLQTFWANSILIFLKGLTGFIILIVIAGAIIEKYELNDRQ